MEIYCVKISDISEEEIEKLCLLIDFEKKIRIKKFKNKKDKIRTLIGEILIRSIIIEKLHIDNNHIKFIKNQYGKPYLQGYTDFKFNISHSEDFVVCAVDDKSIGIDIEEVKSIEYKEISRNCFTVNEFNYINQENSNIQLNRFYKIWTLKESYIKCCGQGLSMPLESFSIDIDKGNIKVIVNEEYKEHTFIELNYKMAVCSLNKDISDNIIYINQESLINNYTILI